MSLSYRIVSTKQVPSYMPTTCARIIAVGVSTIGGTIADKVFTLEEVLALMIRGTTFYTLGIRSGRYASVYRYNCTRCGRQHITSAADAVPDNNLDSLPVFA
jgi:hypothetical protein